MLEKADLATDVDLVLVDGQGRIACMGNQAPHRLLCDVQIALIN